MDINRKHVRLLGVSLAGTFVWLRGYLYVWPNADLNIGPYNIHHLYTGLLLITLCGLPLAIFRGSSRLLEGASVGFGAGLAMALDEWVYLIATDGSNASYLLPVSFWGGMTMVGLACGYIFALSFAASRASHGSSVQPAADRRVGQTGPAGAQPP